MVNGIPLVTELAVLSAVPSLYTIVNGPVPAVAVHVSSLMSETHKGPFPDKLP